MNDTGGMIMKKRIICLFKRLFMNEEAIPKEINRLKWKRAHAHYAYTNPYEYPKVHYQAITVMLRCDRIIERLEKRLTKLRKNKEE